MKSTDIADDLWTATHATRCPRTCQPSQRSFRQPHPLLLRDDGQDADDGIAEHPTGVQILFFEAPEPAAIAGQGLEMSQAIHSFIILNQGPTHVG